MCCFKPPCLCLTNRITSVATFVSFQPGTHFDCSILQGTGTFLFFFCALLLFMKYIFLAMVMSSLAFYCGHLPWSSSWAPPCQKIPTDNMFMYCSITWLSWIYRARCVWHRGTDLVPTLCQQHLWWTMERGSSTHEWGHVLLLRDTCLHQVSPSGENLK